jgi:hypothetical protein
LAEVTVSEAKFNIKKQLVPGTKALVYRQKTIEGPIKHSGSEERATPPPPLSSGKALRTDDTKELKQFDRGHLVALDLDGQDKPTCIVPQNRQLNQSGKWRQMEISIGSLIDGFNLQDVLNGVVSANRAKDGTKIKLSLKTLNTVKATWNMEVYLFYDDTVGDSRVPIWFYVRVYCLHRLRTHFSMANRCSKASTMPTKNEILDFEAAAQMFDEYITWDEEHRAKISRDRDIRRMYKVRTDQHAPPNQLLQFMDEIEVASDRADLPYCFAGMQTTAFGGMTPYSTFQRRILRKFNRWKNSPVHNGLLKSDVPTPGLYVDEDADAWQTLDECGGRASPEVDHVNPSYQQGGNTYINGRLVSFYHNHLYREKKTNGAMEVGHELAQMYEHGEVRLYNIPHPAPEDECVTLPLCGYNALDQGTPEEFLTGMFSDDWIFELDGESYKFTERMNQRNMWGVEVARQLRAARQTFLEARLQRQLKQQREIALGPAYANSAQSLTAGINAFVTNVNHPERLRLEALINGAGVPLCKPSDILTPGMAGIQNLEADDIYPVFNLANEKLLKYYTDLMKSWADLKEQLEIP